MYDLKIISKRTNSFEHLKEDFTKIASLECDKYRFNFNSQLL